ncbi:MAG: hypothetical protein ABSD08_11285 [Xanthobacteraceae bacterium]|jgi:hypothetical protein
MVDLHPTDELKWLRQFLEKLESGKLSLHRSRVDVTKSEAAVIKREIAYLEKVLSRLKNRPA